MNFIVIFLLLFQPIFFQVNDSVNYEQNAIDFLAKELDNNNIKRGKISGETSTTGKGSSYLMIGACLEFYGLTTIEDNPIAHEFLALDEKIKLEVFDEKKLKMKKLKRKLKKWFFFKKREKFNLVVNNKVEYHERIFVEIIFSSENNSHLICIVELDKKSGEALFLYSITIDY